MIDQVSEAQSHHEKRFGVLIASSRFPEEPKLHDLSCPENDVDGLFELLSNESFGGFQEIQVVKNQSSYEALRSVHRVLRKAGRDDLVLIFYAGHGKLDRAGRLHLATVETVNDELETTSIPAQRIRDLIDNADSGKVALILDCCYSGAIDKTFLRGDVAEQLNLMASGRGTFIMTASSDIQTAREEAKDGYGVFTKHLLDGMRGAADVDGNGVVTMNELYDYVHAKVLAESHQVPMKWNLNVEGEMVIARTGRKPRQERRLAIRTQLFKLADDGLLPDMIFTRALEISNLSHDETRSGAASRYDSLLDRLLEEDLRVGEFISDWLQVPADDEAPGPEREPALPAGPAVAPEQPSPAMPASDQPPPKEKVEPAAKDDDIEPLLPPGWSKPKVSWFWKFVLFPRRATQANLDRHPLYRIAHAGDIKRRELARIAVGQKVRTTWADVLTCVAWLASGFPFLWVMITSFKENNWSFLGNTGKSQAQSGALIAVAIWIAVGWFLVSHASHRLNLVGKGLYGLGFLAGAALIVTVFQSM